MGAHLAWWIGLGVLIVYELYAVFTHRQTLSEALWSTQKRWPWVKWLTGAILLALLDHFVLRIWL